MIAGQYESFSPTTDQIWSELSQSEFVNSCVIEEVLQQNYDIWIVPADVKMND